MFEQQHRGQIDGGEERPAQYKPDELDLEEEAKLQNEGVGENFYRYKEQKVTCVPLDIVKPIEKFSDVIESKLLLENVKNLKYSDLTPIQKWAMPAIIDGYDIIGCAQTGSGKTAAFLLPILQTILKTDLDSHDPNDDCQHPHCLVVSPTRELARQIYTHAEMLSKDSLVKCRVIYGQIATAHLKAKISQGCHVLVATPGRLKDFVQRGWIGFKNIKYIVLDEGDRLVDDGFMGDIRSFFAHESMPPKDERQTLFFSATFKPEVQSSAKEYLKENFVFLTVGRVGAANEDIKQEFLQVNRRDKKRELKNILNSMSTSDKTIVFTQTKIGADMLAAFFTQLGLSSTSIHGDRHQSQREQAISSFKRGDKRFLISSPVGNRGLDLPKVALVINYDLPDNIDEYVHRIGRTGRAGHTGRAISFFDPERDIEVLPSLLSILEEAKQEIPEWMKNGGQMGTSSGDDWAASGVTGGDDAEDWGSCTTSSISKNNEPGANSSNAWGTETTQDDHNKSSGEGWIDPSDNKNSGGSDWGASSSVDGNGNSGWTDGGSSGGGGWGIEGSSDNGGWNSSSSGQSHNYRGSFDVDGFVGGRSRPSRGGGRSFGGRPGGEYRGQRFNDQRNSSSFEGRPFRSRGNRFAGGSRGGGSSWGGPDRNDRSNDGGWGGSNRNDRSNDGGWGGSNRNDRSNDGGWGGSNRNDRSNEDGWNSAPKNEQTGDEGWGSSWGESDSKRPADEPAGNAPKRDNIGSGNASNKSNSDGWSSGW